jgi:hypothetical protein
VTATPTPTPTSTPTVTATPTPTPTTSPLSYPPSLILYPTPGASRRAPPAPRSPGSTGTGATA